jgi:hypothetical protein
MNIFSENERKFFKYFISYNLKTFAKPQCFVNTHPRLFRLALFTQITVIQRFVNAIPEVNFREKDMKLHLVVNYNKAVIRYLKLHQTLEQFSFARKGTKIFETVKVALNAYLLNNLKTLPTPAILFLSKYRHYPSQIISNLIICSFVRTLPQKFNNNSYMVDVFEAIFP